MNVYDIVVLVQHKSSKDWIELFKHTIESQNKKEVEQYCLRNDFQQYLNLMFLHENMKDSENKLKKTVKIQTLFNGNICSEFEQTI